MLFCIRLFVKEQMYKPALLSSQLLYKWLIM